MTVTIPGSVSLAQLAEVLGVSEAEVASGLDDLGESSTGPISGRMAVVVAAALGVEARVEPRDEALAYLYARETMGEPELPEGRAGEIAAGVLDRLDEIDGMIESVSQHWTVSRMPVIDRNVLRMAVFELQSDAGVPTSVVIAEAVRLAAAYSTERSAPFVNGVLSSLAKDLRG